MKKSFLRLSLISMLSLLVVGCGDKVEESLSISKDNSNADISLSTSESSTSVSETNTFAPSKQDEVLNLIPQEVLDANVEIDFVTYVEGQDSVMNDMGNYCWDTSDPDYDKYKYHPEDVTHSELFKWIGAASAFKKLAPNVKINVKYCSIADYPTRVEKYQETYGHLPHMLWSTESVYLNLQKGYCVDLSEYSNSEYYNQYNEYFLSRFNFGGFQAAFPTHADPWGTFVNLDILSDANNPVVLNPVVDGECTEEYQNWVDNLTWENYVDAAKKVHNDNHAGNSQMMERVLSTSFSNIYAQYVNDGTIDLTSNETKTLMQKLLGYEQTLSQYSVYNYNDVSYAQPKDVYTEAHVWSSIKNFCLDQYSLFASEMPWSYTDISQYINSHAGQSGIVKNIDYLPYPKVSEDATTNSAVGIGAMIVGNQCPIVDGKEVCYSKDSKLEQEVAAYFTMFASLDPRSIKAQSEMEYFLDGTRCKGVMTLPLVKKGSKFSWQYDEEVTALYPDPAVDYDDNFTYQLYQWLNLYNIYITNTDKKIEPTDDLKSNIMYGFYKMLDSMYMFEQDYVTCVNFNTEPASIELGGETHLIFDEWQNRYNYYQTQDENTGLYSGSLGTSTYVSMVLDNLSSIEDHVNSNSKKVWEYLQACVDDYYYDEEGNSLYPYANDKSYRQQYEGNPFND